MYTRQKCTCNFQGSWTLCYTYVKHLSFKGMVDYMPFRQSLINVYFFLSFKAYMEKFKKIILSILSEHPKLGSFLASPQLLVHTCDPCHSLACRYLTQIPPTTSLMSSHGFSLCVTGRIPSFHKDINHGITATPMHYDFILT